MKEMSLEKANKISEKVWKEFSTTLPKDADRLIISMISLGIMRAMVFLNEEKK